MRFANDGNRNRYLVVGFVDAGDEHEVCDEQRDAQVDQHDGVMRLDVSATKHACVTSCVPPYLTSYVTSYVASCVTSCATRYVNR